MEVRELRGGPAFYARWRDSTRTQMMRKIGPAWIERYGGEWRKRRGDCPEGHLVPDEATVRMRELIDAHELELVESSVGVHDGELATFKDVAWAWHEHGRAVSGWKPSTVRDRRSTLNGHLVPAFGARPIRDITRDEVRKWWRGLHDTRRKGGRLSDRNANKLLAELRAIFNWARDDYRLADNPGDGIRKHRELTSERPNFYSVAEVERLIAHAERRDGLIFRVAAFAGLRRGEVISLRWRHIDFDRSLIHVVENVSAGQDARVKDSEGRTVPLAPQLAEPLKEWRPDASPVDDLVFPGTLTGRKLDGDALGARFRVVRDKAKLRALRFHDLRHTFGSLAVDGGASLVQVQAWMGHADIATTMRYLRSKSRTEDAALLGAAFAPR
jgi:integrase